MSDSRMYSKGDKGKTQRRNIPSRMDTNEDENTPHKEMQVDMDGRDKAQDHKERASKQSTNSLKGEPAETSVHFSKLMEGVVFVLSGFVNPERTTLRSQALEMGGEYRPDWTSECTLLVCAFRNTPKFRQVEADCGTVVSKDWIAECYNQKRLVDIDRYLMYAGKPWRRSYAISSCNRDQGSKESANVSNQLERRPLQEVDDSSIFRHEVCGSGGKHLSPSTVKGWAIADLTSTISWLEKQEERPGPDEIKKIAAEGIITCLQDTIEALDNDQDIQSVTEQWMFVPGVVKELAKLDSGTRKNSLTNEDLSKLVVDCKHLYEEEFNRLDDSSVERNQRKGSDDNEKREVASEDEAFDSDSTIEMTEEEIYLAYRGFLSS